jgi:pimeloyl-ACP methyl ester carboxylesterase
MNTTLLSLVAVVALGPQSSDAQAPHFAVQVSGTGKPVILIPGLTCPGSVWDATVQRLKGHYKCYVLTLPGFAGQPPMSTDNYMVKVRDEIVAYVKDQKLDHPAVIGHSLGGFLVFSLGSTAPSLFGPLIAVDGLPWLPALDNPKATVESSRPMAQLIANYLKKSSPVQFSAGVKASLVQEITDPGNVEQLLPICSRSDPATVAEAMLELYTTDLRPDLGRIQSPLLLLGAGALAKTDTNKAAIQAVYMSEVSTIPDATVRMDWKSRHFIQLDDPEFFYSEVQSFLNRH